MQEMSGTPGKGIMRELVRAVMGIALLMLVTGVWVCLWVPPSF